MGDKLGNFEFFAIMSGPLLQLKLKIINEFDLTFPEAQTGDELTLPDT